MGKEGEMPSGAEKGAGLASLQICLLLVPQRKDFTGSRGGGAGAQ